MMPTTQVSRMVIILDSQIVSMNQKLVQLTLMAARCEYFRLVDIPCTIWELLATCRSSLHGPAATLIPTRATTTPRCRSATNAGLPKTSGTRTTRTATDSSNLSDSEWDKHRQVPLRCTTRMPPIWRFTAACTTGMLWTMPVVFVRAVGTSLQMASGRC